ncbi:hypothetical protein [Neorhodopirellula pilleata]|uniref:Uncharacterized protein n=1 Tax=Neorhodopirellula pilleata TaxID=2714738 RepID=A0A5C6A7V5_9BACT|nr:hypothetical protein [Neorhodopirellula pilleata]TWT95599.1 hypothetical protein Pla100_32400 [Neorhodopirellula pilleata]
MRIELTKRNLSADQPRRASRARWGKRALLVTCLITPMLSTGCRSGKPGWNLFGRRGEPSAEMLAGSGPTLTYPAPPSAKATPEAIASIAGGTATPTPSTPTTPSMGVPGVTPPGGSNPYALAGNQTAPPAYAIPGSTPPPSTAASASPTPSYAAAAANGYAAGGTPIASGTTPTQSTASANNSTGSVASAPATQTKLPSGYQLAGASPPATTSEKTSTDAAPKANAFALPAMNSLTPSRLAGGQTASGQTPASPSATSASTYANGGGFTLPSGIVAAPSTTPPTASATQADIGTAVAALGASPTSTSKPAGASSPLSTDASSSPEFKSATATKSSSTNTSAGSVRPAGYMPGSTSASSGYPIQR